MNKLRLVFLSLLTAFALSSCAMFGQPLLPVSQELSQPAQVAQTIINESRVTVIAAANVTLQYLNEGWLTKAEARGYYEKLNGWNEKLSAAQKLLDAGDILNAKTQAELIQMAVVALHNDVVKRKATQ